MAPPSVFFGEIATKKVRSDQTIVRVLSEIEQSAQFFENKNIIVILFFLKRSRHGKKKSQRVLVLFINYKD